MFKVTIRPVSTSFLVLSTRLHTVYSGTQTPKRKQSCTYRLELVRRTRLVVKLCAHAAAPKKNSQKRQTTCCSADQRVPRRRREPKHRAPRSQAKRVYMSFNHAVCKLRQGVCITQSQGSMSKPILRSALKCPREIGQRVIGRAFR
jgi:hypothetical protein